MLLCACLPVLILCGGGWDLGEVLKNEIGSGDSGGSTQGKGNVDSSSYRADGVCSYSNDATIAMRHLACNVESGSWYVPSTARALKESPCLIDQIDARCKAGVRHIPTEDEVPASDPPPDAKNKDYQRYAEKAEELVPSTWWRRGFSNDQFLLSHNDKELPYKQFNERKSMNNKKLKNLVQCVTRQQFIRKAFSFSRDIATGDSEQGGPTGEKGDKCSAQQDPAVRSFYESWKAAELYGGVLRRHDSGAGATAGGAMPDVGWYAAKKDNGALYMHAVEALQFYYANVGGIWTGCFRLTQSSFCRGGLAAASLVSSIHLLEDVCGHEIKKTGNTRIENNIELGPQIVQGYLLASLGRGLLHGDMDSTGNEVTTEWKLRLSDFVLLQQAFLRLYMGTFGKIYTEQLNSYLPQAFPPGLEMYTKKRWKNLHDELGPHFLEPVYSHLRNWMYTEGGNLIDFGPYRPLVSVPQVNAALQLDAKRGKRRVLVDVGANGFFASPKYLLDSYAVYLPFTDAIMIEPEPHFKASIPEAYSDRYKISHHKIYAEVNTGTENDILKLLATLVTKEDFVVLKFDVDPNKFAYGPTMEWGFLFDLARNPDVADLVDELYIELHFHFPALYWKHYHSNWEALDAIRFLREKGAVIHAWP